MADTRFSREDYVRLARFHEDRCRAAGPHQPPECFYCETAAALREAANQASSCTPTPEPGAPQRDGPTMRPSAPAEGASGDRCSRCGHVTRGHREAGVEHCTTCGGVL